MIDFSPPSYVRATVSDIHRFIADRAVQLHGGHGLMKESGIEKIFRIARNLYSAAFILSAGLNIAALLLLLLLKKPTPVK